METILETWSLPYHLMKSLLTVFKYELLMMMREIWVYFYGSYKYFSRCTPLIWEWFSLSLALKDTINQISWESGQGLGYVLSSWLYHSKGMFSSVQFICSVVSDSLQPHESQHGPPCPSLTHWVYSNSCPSSRWCHPAIPSYVVLFSSCSQSLPASESFPINQLFTWGSQSTGVSALASVLPKNTWSPLEWTGWITMQSKGLSRVFSNTTAQKHEFFSAQLSSQSNSHIHTGPLEKP